MLLQPPLNADTADDGGWSAPSVTEALRAALAPPAARIDAAFIYGPAVKDAAARGDIELMIIGRDIAYAEVIPLLIGIAKHTGCAINPSVYGASEWTRKLAMGNRVAL